MPPDPAPSTDAQPHAAHAKPRRLGRGLASLIASTRNTPPHVHPGHAAPAGAAGAYLPVGVPPPSQASPRQPEPPTEISVDRIRPNPYQPRKAFDEAELAELADSIRRQGVLQPLLVVRSDQPGDDGFILAAGERRLRAARLAGLATVPCVVRQAGREQMLEWALIENIQRSDLNPVERAIGYRDYLDRFAVSQQELAERVGEPRSTVANYLRLLDLCDEVQELVLRKELSFGHAKVLAGLAGQPERQALLARQVVSGGLSVRQLEELAGATQAAAPAAPAPRTQPPKSQYIQDLERQLSTALGTRVLIRPGRRKNSGRIVVEYHSLDGFDRLIEILGVKLES